MVAAEQILRRVHFAPYRPNAGPTFRLTVWDTYRSDGRGRGYARSWLGYRLQMSQRFGSLGHKRETIFEGEDFGCSAAHAIDSDAVVAGIMALLTCRPGDTDAEYFENYTPAQLAYCQEHAEALASEVARRFVS